MKTRFHLAACQSRPKKEYYAETHCGTWTKKKQLPPVPLELLRHPSRRAANKPA